VTPASFHSAYDRYVAAGWGAMQHPEKHGGGGFPLLASIAVKELITSANMAFSLNPMLTTGAVHLLTHHGSEEQQARYLPRMVTGEWTGTMNLTEPQAGSDVGAVTTRAEPAGDGTYLITGQKIYITYGDHDLSEQIVHLVLARLPDAPPGHEGDLALHRPEAAHRRRRIAGRAQRRPGRLHRAQARHPRLADLRHGVR
jgi:3-(methylthio)propanoyl-CoA dehydrogenase